MDIPQDLEEHLSSAEPLDPGQLRLFAEGMRVCAVGWVTDRYLGMIVEIIKGDFFPDLSLEQREAIIWASDLFEDPQRDGIRWDFSRWWDGVIKGREMKKKINVPAAKQHAAATRHITIQDE